MVLIMLSNYQIALNLLCRIKIYENFQYGLTIFIELIHLVQELKISKMMIFLLALGRRRSYGHQREELDIIQSITLTIEELK
jgi:hypothetical protein